MELSLETFTPELITYYGTLTSTSPTSLTINVDPSCMPEPAPCFEAEEENEVDARELIRAQQRDALMQDRWGECESSRDWEWAAITEVRRLGLSEFETWSWSELYLEALVVFFCFFFMSESLNLVIRRWVKEDLVSRCNLELHDRLISIIWSTEFKETHFGACKKKQKKDWSLAVWIAMTCLSSSAKAGG